MQFEMRQMGVVVYLVLRVLVNVAGEGSWTTLSLCARGFAHVT